MSIETAGPSTRAAIPPDSARLALIVLAVLATLFTLRLMSEVLIPVAIGVLITYPLQPVVAWLSRRRVPRSLGAVLVMLLTLAPLFFGLYALSDELGAMWEQLPKAARGLAREFESMRRTGSSALGAVQETADVLERSANKSAPAAAPGVTRVEVQAPRFNAKKFFWSSGVGAVAVAGNVLMTLFLVYFILASGDLYRRKLVRLGSRQGSQLTTALLDDVNARIGRYLRALLLASLAVAVVSSVAFAWLGLKQYVIWGILCGALNTIPYFGPVLATIGLAVAAAVQFGTVAKVLAVCAVAFAITALEGWGLTPLLMGKAAEMNAMAVFVSLLLWTWIWGVWGTLLAVPIMTMVKAVSDHVEALAWLGELLGE